MSEQITLTMTVGQARWLIGALGRVGGLSHRGSVVRAQVYTLIAHALGEAAEAGAARRRT